ncbi:hypothetical protein [Treponema denticola]|uniref:hypothetical protein n=1 Tax=Treponema denticola TaxID=158 RepID=UPI0001FD3780|nr:hypothetical protein [Treponema denticola]EGC78216.1 hypothetical protein HMPREF9353_01063 [Treponema denticola F0402]UTC86868.1 hypothetical protein E4N79_01380 [Treponema denticola]DAK62929.1 MAG TPA: hypothetical protein [Caudoviricetes sp.]
MKISEAEKKYIFTTKIELDDGDYIELREPNTQEISSFGDDGKKNLELLEKIFPSCVVDSSFTDDSDNKVDGKTLYSFLKKSSSLFTEILNIWIDSIPFQSRLQKKPKLDK